MTAVRTCFFLVITIVAAFYAGEWVGEQKLQLTASQKSVTPLYLYDETLQHFNFPAFGKATQKSDDTDEIEMDSMSKSSINIFESPSFRKLANFFSIKYASQCPSKKDNKPPHEWMSRFPKFSIIGAQKAGTKALRFLLDDHPQVAKSCGAHGMVELHYFDRLKHDPLVLDSKKLQEDYVENIKSKCGSSLEIVKNNNRTVFFDDSPKYLFDTHLVPQNYLCTVPWSKTIAVLRNPIDRAYSQYVFQYDIHCTEKSFDEWVEIDIANMKRVGLLKEGIDFYEEYEAYSRYFESEEMTGEYRFCSFVGRGLYAIQLTHWFAALEGFGLGQNNHLMVIHSNDLSGDLRQETFSKSLDFIGLDPHTLDHETFAHKSDYSDKPPFLDSTRNRLEIFFEPYNKRLYNMLGWNPVWE